VVVVDGHVGQVEREASAFSCLEKGRFCRGLIVRQTFRAREVSDTGFDFKKNVRRHGVVQKHRIIRNALALWEWDPKREEKDLCWRVYTVNEITALIVEDLEYIISLKIAQ
jgi:hypothetical protein